MRPTALLFTAIFALAAQPSYALDAAFDILRKGKPIGVHAVTITEDGDQVIAETEIRMTVKFGFLTVFRYAHDSREVWRDGVLERLDSKTNDNGLERAVSVRREVDQYRVIGTKFDGYASMNAAPSSYWNKEAMLNCEVLINTQTGELIEVETDSLGEAPALLASGGTKLAESYQLRGTVDLDLWYDEDSWVGARFTVRGEELVYAYRADDIVAAQPNVRSGG